MTVFFVCFFFNKIIKRCIERKDDNKKSLCLGRICLFKYMIYYFVKQFGGKKRNLTIICIVHYRQDNFKIMPSVPTQ